MANKKTYHIIGAGVAGLYTAKLLKKKHPRSRVIVYESAEKVGGRCMENFSQSLDCRTDNATHVVLNCNALTRDLIGQDKFVHKIRFWDLEKNAFVPVWRCLKESQLAVFNTPAPDWRAKLFLYRKLFPFLGLRAYFSAGTLGKDLYLPLVHYADELRLGWVWKGVHTQQDYLSELIFNRGKVTLTPDDVVVSAIDSYAYNRLFGGYDFAYQAIDNFFFRTSMALTLPREAKMLGLIKARGQWLFCSPNFAAVTISHVTEKFDERAIWQEICTLRHYNSAFMPRFGRRHFPRATISQDADNNRKRPSSAQTSYKNLFICGDWTMKNQPCCIETALQSARRVCRFL